MFKGDKIPVSLREKLFPLLNKSDCDKVFITDELDGLMCFHYDPKDPSLEKTKKIWDCRGLILDTITGAVVARSFPYTREVVLSNLKMSEIIKKDQNIQYRECLEGTIYRVFRRFEKLYISTHKRISCENSKWINGKTFKEMFEEAEKEMNISLEQLIPVSSTKCYVFILVHPDNQIVNTEEVKPKLYHISTYEGKEQVDVEVVLNGIPQFLTLTSKEALEKFEKGGQIISAVGEPVKYTPESYNSKLSIRGETPNIKQRWYQLWEDGRNDQLKKVTPFSQKKMLEECEKDYLRWSEVPELVVKSYIKGEKIPETLHQLAQSANTCFDSKEQKFIQIKKLYPKDREGFMKEFIHEKIINIYEGNMMYRVISEFLKLEKKLKEPKKD